VLPRKNLHWNSHKSDFRHGIVNKLKNQQQITVLQLSRDYHVEHEFPLTLAQFVRLCGL
jgi:hypothetical protein